MESTNESECSFWQESSDENVNFAVWEEVQRGSAQARGSYEAPPTFQVLSVEKVVERMNEFIKEANVVLQLPPTIMRILLNRFRWNKDVISECYYDGDARPAQNATEVEKSGVCSCLRRASMTYGMACGHRFCTNCWAAYLSKEIGDEMDKITCPAPNCTQLMDDMKVTELVGDAELKLKYQKKIIDSFVHYDPLIKWCPSGCTNALKVDDDKQWRGVTCTCNPYSVCFECGESWHHPFSCELLKMWNQINVTEKQEPIRCQNCNEAVKKEYGRNHIHCSCGALIDTREGDWNVYDKSEIIRDRQQLIYFRERFNSSLKSCYLFYKNWYLDQAESQKFEKELGPLVMAKVRDDSSLLVRNELPLLEKVFDILSKSRQTLMHSFIFAYFFKEPKQINQERFESNQRDLAKATEQLSEYLQLINENFEETKGQHKTHDKLEYCVRRYELLVDNVQEGYDEGWWELDDDLFQCTLAMAREIVK